LRAPGRPAQQKNRPENNLNRGLPVEALSRSRRRVSGCCLFALLLMAAATRSLYFENSHGRLWEEPAGYVRLEYKAGPRDPVPFRALLTHAAQALSRRGWSRMLVDQREMAPFNPTEQDWMTNEWLPRAVNEHGYRLGAVLVAHNVFARLAMNQFVMATRGLPHTYRTFEAEAEALAWLAGPGGNQG
jgi:hypothetical protein